MKPRTKRNRLKISSYDPSYLAEVSSCSVNPWDDGNSDSCPGALLPADFPRDDFSPDQLVLLEEYFIALSRAAIYRSFKLIESTRCDHSGPPTAESLGLCVAICGKIMGLAHGITWRRMGEIMHVAPETISRVKRQLLLNMKMMIRPIASKAEKRATAALLIRQARIILHSITDSTHT